MVNSRCDMDGGSFHPTVVSCPGNEKHEHEGAEASPVSLSALTSDNGLYVTQVRHDRVGFMLIPINECYPYMQKKHDTITQDIV
jgi:hypothetical protein